MQAIEAQAHATWFIFSVFGFCHIRRIDYPTPSTLGSGALA